MLDFFPSENQSGDQEPVTYWGDSIEIDPGENHRIYFQNIDGLRNDVDEIDLYVSSMAQLKIGTFCWADPGLAFSNLGVRRNLQKPLHSHFSHARCAYSSSKLPPNKENRNSSYQPGGTFMATTGKWTTRSTGKAIEDPSGLGRWSGLTYLGKRNKRLTVLTAYRSPRQQPSAGFGFYDQQYALLLSQGVKAPNVRRQFITDITKFINNLQSEGHEIILSLDANEILGQEKMHGIGHLLDECTLTDLHGLGPSVPPATYKYGTDRRIDFMLGSPNVANCIRSAGFLEYDNGIFSKHRGLFIDVDFNELMGSVDNITPAPARRLNSENQVSVDRYLEALKKYFDDHQIDKRISELMVIAPVLSTSQCKDSYDAIDRDITRGMLHAEKEAKRPAGKYAWSPKLREAGILTRYWHLRLKELESGQSFLRVLSGIRHRVSSLHIPLSDELGSDSALVKIRWKEQLANLKTIRNAAYDYRVVHLHSTLAIYQALDPEGSSAKAANKIKIQRIIRLINIERMRKPFRAIHIAVSTARSAGLTKLFVPIKATNPHVAAKFCQPDGSLTHDNLISMAQYDITSVEYATILDCDEIEHELLRYNQRWFRQAHETPFGHGELCDLVGYDGLTEAATNIVSGVCIDHMGLTMSRELKVFLEECKRPASVPDIRTQITLDEFKKNVKQWKESTSTSPSGRHLGHYRTALSDDRVSSVHTDMLNIPITYGFAPDRWTQSVTPLIEKDEGKPYLTRLRVIHLFEADYNLFLKILFGKRLVRNAEKHNALNDQQHGSRPRRMTTDALFLSRLEKDLVRQTKSNSAHMDNDATGCYDRIVTSLGMIACRRLGMPCHAIRCQSDTLFNMKYAVKHVYGISTNQYSSTIQEPLFGIGQGSGASPAVWLSLVVILLNSLDRMSKEDDIPALSFTDPWAEIAEEWRVGAFVDDTNQGVTDPTGDLSMEGLVEKLRQAGQMWERLLHVSGGSLNLAKCSWTLQYWSWKKGRPYLNPSMSSDPLLLMTSGSTLEHHIITRHDNATALKGLGVHMNFLGTFSHHAKLMKSKFASMARRLRQSHLPTGLSRAFYQSFYVPSVKYSLPVTSMHVRELHAVQSKMTASILNALGYNQHYPHSVVFAPQHVFGVGLYDLRIEQGLAQIQALLDYVGTAHKIGKVMLISLRQLQAEAGVSFDLFRIPTTPVCFLTDCWLVGVRNFCSLHGISLSIRNNRVPQLARVYDSCLMDHALQMDLTKQQLIDLNLARMHLQVTTVSDIATACGKSIHPWIWKGKPIPDRHSRIQFARQPVISSGQRSLWKGLLRNLLSPDATTTSLCLHKPLGAWQAESNMIWGTMTWNSNLYRRDPANDTGERHISVHFPRQFVHANGYTGSGTFYDSQPDWYSATVPRLATPTDIEGTHIFTATSALTDYPLPGSPATTFQEWVQRLPAAEHRLISSVYFSTSDAEHTLIQYLQLECTVLIGTDGGKKHHRGSFSWIICSPGQEQLVLNAGPVDGWTRCQSSLRSEATALTSVTLYLDELAVFHSLTIRCTFLLYVDSMGAISNVSNLRDLIPKRKFANHDDLLSTMRAAHDVIKHFHLHHVKSHQDDKVPFDELPFSAQLNVLCDKMATAQLKRQLVNAGESTHSQAPCPRHLPIEVSLNNQNISSHYISRLRDEISIRRHRYFLQEKYKWSDHTLSVIAWDAFVVCGHRVTTSNAPNRSKLVHNWLHLGVQRAKHSQDKSDTIRACPYCALPEDFVHLLSCTAPRALKFRYDAYEILRKALNTSAEDQFLLRAVKQWTLTPTDDLVLTPGVSGSQSSIDRVLRTQSSIGWTNLFRGFLSVEWGSLTATPDSSVTIDDHTANVTHHLSVVIRALQDYSLAIWKSRNDVLHANDAGCQAILQADLHRQISLLYSLGPTYSPIIQSYFSVPLDIRLTRPLRHKQRWLRLALLATSHATAQGSRQQVISNYFPYAPTATVLPDSLPLVTATHHTASRIPLPSATLPVSITTAPTPQATANPMSHPSSS
jgi:hypothetical protein